MFFVPSDIFCVCVSVYLYSKTDAIFIIIHLHSVFEGDFSLENTALSSVLNLYDFYKNEQMSHFR